MPDSPPKKIIIKALVSAMEEAELVVGASGADKRLYVVEAMRAIAARTLSVDDASLVGSLIPSLVDLLASASKGLLHVNEKGEPSPRCFGKSCALS